MDPESEPEDGRDPPPLLRFMIRSDGSLEPEATPEANYGQAGMLLVFHLSPAIPPSLAPTGSIVLYLLREQLSRSPPLPRAPRTWRTFAEYRIYTIQARRILIRTFISMLRVDAALGRGRTPELARRLMGRGVEINVVSRAARNIVQCLGLLQTRTRPCQFTCLQCRRRPAFARGPEDRAENATNTLEVESYYRRSTGEHTTVDAVSILPPMREFDPPM